MKSLFAGLDVADAETKLCVLSSEGVVVLEVAVATNAAAVVKALRPHRPQLKLVGLESSAKSTWLHKELKRARLRDVVCLDAFHTHAALAANRNKTDKNDARGIAEVLCRGIYSEAYVRGDESIYHRALLGHRRALLQKQIDLQLLANGTAKLVGGKIRKVRGKRTVGSLTRRALPSEMVALLMVTEQAAASLGTVAKRLDEMVVRAAHNDPICRRLMTMPGVGPITALTFRWAVDDPTRFQTSRNVPGYFGLTPRTYQSGDKRAVGAISKRGDHTVRTALPSRGCAHNQIALSMRIAAVGVTTC